MDENYTLDYMIKVFTDHVEKTEKDRKDHPERHIPREDDNFPEFNICKAFLTFSKELKNLKEEIRVTDSYLHNQWRSP
jgi:hypothetical protein